MAIDTPAAVDLVAPAGPASAAATRTEPARTPEQLRSLAAQFESVLISQMLQQMRSSLLDDETDSGFGSGPLGDTMFSELSLALSRAGGFGLTESLIDPLVRQAGVPASGGSELTNLPTATLPVLDEQPSARAPLFDGRLTSQFGWRQHPLTGATAFHKGVDIAMPAGRDVPSAQAGTVTFAGEQGAYGLTVVVDHGQGVATRYAHLSALQVSAGDVVTAGQTIALSGATGRVTGAHLHFEVLEDGQPVEPSAGVGRLHARR